MTNESDKGSILNFTEGGRGALETSHGVLYRPAKGWIQILVFLVTFVGSLVAGALLSLALGARSGFAEAVLYVPCVLIFGFGYAGWATRLGALGFELIGLGLLKALYQLIVHRRKPASLAEVLPDADRMTRAAVQAQKAASSFFFVSILIGMIAAMLSLSCDMGAGVFVRAPAIAAACFAWGRFLAVLGRRGYLPFPEGE